GVWVMVAGASEPPGLLAPTTISTAMTIASVPSTPAAHSSARCPAVKVRRGGGVRWFPVPGRARRAAVARADTGGATRGAAVDGIADGAARPGGSDWLGRVGRRPERTAATASANGPPLR